MKLFKHTLSINFLNHSFITGILSSICVLSAILILSFKGLNLTIETLDGLFKHNGPIKNLTQYKKVIYLAQSKSKSLQQDAKKYADFLDLDYSFHYTGLDNLKSQLNQSVN